MFSKYGFAFPLKTKTGKETAIEFEKLLQKRRPQCLQTDMGGEFDNKYLKPILEKLGISFFTTRNTEIKCSLVERFNRTLRLKMFKYFTSKGTRRYLDVLEKLVVAYNKTKHRAIGMAPEGVTPDQKDEIFRKLYGCSNERELLRKRYGKAGLSTGDQVRIPYSNEPFEKGYYPSWTDEVFTVDKASEDYKKAQYTLKDAEGNQIEGRFYPEEVQKITNVVYRVEKVLRRRTLRGVKQCYVKWLNFGSSQNSWIEETDLRTVS